MIEPTVAALELALAENRRVLDKVARRVALAQPPVDAADLARPKFSEPLLSIAIPVYNRPDLFAECLASIERDLVDIPKGAVEVCIADDASSDPDTVDVAAAFVRRTGVAVLGLNPLNLGMEGNLLKATSLCSGRYVLVLGSDDRLIGGAIPAMLAQVADGRAGVYVFDQTRITLDGRPRASVEGSVPIDIAPGASHDFPTLVDGIRRYGLISTIGFTSTVVFRRHEFTKVDAQRYFGLTVYPLAFIIADALGQAPMRYTNTAIVEHRTPAKFEKHAEGMGSKEPEFMRGGPQRAARHFGTTLAASYQRLIESGAVDAGTVADLPEWLLTPKPLLEWISECRTVNPEIDDTFDPAVVADADRLFAPNRPATTHQPAGSTAG